MGNSGRFFRPYYFCHLALALSYPVARLWAVRRLKGSKNVTWANDLGTDATLFVCCLVFCFRRWHKVNVRGLTGGMVHTEAEVVSWEKQAFSLLSIVAVVKFVKQQSLDSFFSNFFLYLKVTLAVLSFVLDIR